MFLVFFCLFVFCFVSFLFLTLQIFIKQTFSCVCTASRNNPQFSFLLNSDLSELLECTRVLKTIRSIPFVRSQRDAEAWNRRLPGPPRFPGNNFCRPHFVGVPSTDAITLSTTRWRHGEKKTGGSGQRSNLTGTSRFFIILSS